MNNERSDHQTYYQILEISPDATPQMINQAYQKAKQAYSVDSPALYTMFTPEEARQLVALIEEAYATLSSMPKRKDYDLRLMRERGGEPLISQSPSPDPTANKIPDGFRVPPPILPPKTAANSPTPDGHGKTRFGVYQLNPEFEKEIETALEFDGPFLKRIREYRGIKIEQLAEASKVSKAYLNAIEANDFKSLPAAVFIRGFVAQFARLAGLNEKSIADGYMKFYKKSQVG